MAKLSGVIYCPECGQKYRFIQDKVGKKMKCVKCGHSFPMPRKPQTSPPKIDKKPTAKKEAPAREEISAEVETPKPSGPVDRVSAKKARAAQRRVSSEPLMDYGESPVSKESLLDDEMVAHAENIKSRESDNEQLADGVERVKRDPDRLMETEQQVVWPIIKNFVLPALFLIIGLATAPFAQNYIHQYGYEDAVLEYEYQIGEYEEIRKVIDEQRVYAEDQGIPFEPDSVAVLPEMPVMPTQGTMTQAFMRVGINIAFTSILACGAFMLATLVFGVTLEDSWLMSFVKIIAIVIAPAAIAILLAGMLSSFAIVAICLWTIGMMSLLLGYEFFPTVVLSVLLWASNVIGIGVANAIIHV